MRFKLLVLSILFFSCGSEDSKNEYPVIKIYKEVLIAREVNPDSSIANKKIDSIFQSYGTSEPEFRKRIIEQSQNRDDFIKLIDSLRNSIKSEKDSLQREKLKNIMK